MHKLGRAPALREIAAALNIDEDGILEVMRLYARIDLHSQNEPFSGDDMGIEADRQAVRSLRQESFALPIEDRIVLYDALDTLTGFQRRLVYLLFFKQLTQSEVADLLGLSQKKVSREQIKLLARLRQALGQRVA